MYIQANFGSVNSYKFKLGGYLICGVFLPYHTTRTLTVCVLNGLGRISPVCVNYVRNLTDGAAGSFDALSHTLERVCVFTFTRDGVYSHVNSRALHLDAPYSHPFGISVCREPVTGV